MNFIKSGSMLPTKKIIAVSLLTFAGHSLYAQKGMEMGLRMNIQTSSMISKDDQAAGPELDYKNNTGVAFGIGGTYMFNTHVGLGLDFLYSKQGQGYKGDASRISPMTTTVPDMSQKFSAMAISNAMPLAGNYTARRDVTYMKIPIMLRYTGKNTKKLYFSSFIGPQISLLTAAKYQINGHDINLTPMDAKDTYKKMNIDLTFGVGAAMNISKNISVSLHLRADYGLGDAEDKSGSLLYPTGRAAAHNATGGGFISFNYKFAKKEKEAEQHKAPMTAKEKAAEKDRAIKERAKARVKAERSKQKAKKK